MLDGCGSQVKNFAEPAIAGKIFHKQNGLHLQSFLFAITVTRPL